MKKFSIRYSEAETLFTKVKVNNESLIMIEAEGYINISDEYHSMHDLYQHRMALNIALFHYMHQLNSEGIDVNLVMKSKKHFDGTMFEGYFIVMAITREGQISYHYKLKHWDKFKIPEVPHTPPYDGHTSLDILKRLEKI